MKRVAPALLLAVVVLVTAATAEAALFLTLSRSQAAPGTTVIAYEPVRAWGPVAGIEVYLVP